MPTQRPLLFNPHQASTQELEATLVRNGSLLEKMERDLLEDQRRHTPRHWQVIGPRGSGKSHLTELILRHMKEQYEWRVVRLPEEHYQTASVSELLEQILIRLSDKPSPYADVRDPIRLEELVLTDLKRTRNIGHRPILVVAENLRLLLEHQLSSTRDQARLRQILTTDPPFIVIATATSHLFATRDHSAPFYDFFQTLVLDDLTREEISELVMARAKWDDATELLSTWGRVSSQLDAIYHLSGGNPRLVVALYNVLREGVTSELHSQFLQLLDEVTPYFQDRLGDVAPQAARILAIMSVADGPITPAEIARRCRMSTNQVTAQIQKLQDQRLVVPGGRPNLRSRYYEIKDRLFRIWLQMREDRALRGKLHFLVEFYQRWYGERFDQLELATRKLTETLWENLDTGDKARCSDCLRTLDYLGSAVNWDAEVLVSKALGDIVDVPNGDVPTLRLKREKLLELYRDPRFRPNRELLGFMIALISDWLDEGDRSLAILRELVEHGAQSEQVLSVFIRHLIEHDEYTEAWDRAQALAISNPNSSALTEVAALAAVSAGKIDDGLALARKALKTDCKSCRQRISVQMARALSKRDKIDRVLPLFAEAIGSSAAQAEESLVAIAKIAVGKKLAKKDFLLASKLWTHLSDAPPWFLQSGVCRLSHIEGAAPLALEYLSAIADTLSVGFLQPAVDHLIEVAAQLQAEAEKNSGSRAIRERALSLVESRTDPKHLAAAFRRQAPYLARRRPQLRIHLLELYQQLRDRGLLEADISPYAEARTVMKSSDKDAALIALHPEVREAVALLLSGERQPIAPDSVGRESRGASVAN